MTEVTPGPWRSQRHSLGWSVFGPYTHADEASPWVAANLSEANARLIAAAPELLAACKQAVKATDVYAQKEALDYLYAVIAKAEGK